MHIALDKGLGSVMLLGATALSLYLANSGYATDFIGFWEHFHLGPKSLGLFLNAHEWVNEGLMAIFFFNVGLEIKREFAFGSLSDVKAALLPCFGALGGMIAPMGIYLACNMVGARDRRLRGHPGRRSERRQPQVRLLSTGYDPSNPSRRTRAPFPARGARTVSSSSSSFPGFRQTQEIN